MSPLHDSRLAFENHILAALPREEYQRLSPHLEEVRLAKGKVLHRAGDAVNYAYFLRGGMASFLSATEDGRVIEVGLIGKEGVAGLPAALGGNRMPYQIAMQIPANAVRVRSAKLREEFKRGGCLQDLLLRCMHALFVQVAQSATCSSFHTVEERLCRWLLIARDHVQTDTLHLTQEFLSHMLGVTRTSVTTVAVSLQKSGLIGYSRGKITILDRRGLEAASCGCYRVVREEMARLFAA